MKRFYQPRYRGRHVIAMRGEIFTARTGREASALLDKLTKKFPGESPTITYVPKLGALILILR